MRAALGRSSGMSVGIQVGLLTITASSLLSATVNRCFMRVSGALRHRLACGLHDGGPTGRLPQSEWGIIARDRVRTRRTTWPIEEKLRSPKSEVVTGRSHSAAKSQA